MEFGECLFFYVQNRIVNANASFGELFDHSAKNGILHIRYTKVETFGWLIIIIIIIFLSLFFM